MHVNLTYIDSTECADVSVCVNKISMKRYITNVSEYYKYYYY